MHFLFCTPLWHSSACLWTTCSTISHFHELNPSQEFKRGLSNVSCLRLLTCHFPTDAVFLTITSPFTACYRSNNGEQTVLREDSHLLQSVTCPRLCDASSLTALLLLLLLVLLFFFLFFFFLLLFFFLFTSLTALLCCSRG